MKKIILRERVEQFAESENKKGNEWTIDNIEPPLEVVKITPLLRIHQFFSIAWKWECRAHSRTD